jgi:hypothetical protein
MSTAVVVFSDSVLMLWVSGSDLAIVLVLSLGGSDLAVVVFQKACCCCDWVVLAWLLLFFR